MTPAMVLLTISTTISGQPAGIDGTCTAKWADGVERACIGLGFGLRLSGISRDNGGCISKRCHDANDRSEEES